jgi:quaternary ammonium compound-resistance protein SugE
VRGAGLPRHLNCHDRQGLACLAARQELFMAWFILIMGGLFELGWLTALKFTEGFTRLLPSVFVGIFMIASIGCLGLAVKSIPLGTAYAAWTGTSIAAAAALGIFLFDEPVTLIRLISIGLIILGIIGLKIES